MSLVIVILNFVFVEYNFNKILVDFGCYEGYDINIFILVSLINCLE